VFFQTVVSIVETDSSKNTQIRVNNGKQPEKLLILFFVVENKYGWFALLLWVSESFNDWRVIFSFCHKGTKSACRRQFAQNLSRFFGIILSI
jgi:hypothetical protein